MALVPTYYTEDVFDRYTAPGALSQGLSETRIRIGWYRNLADGTEYVIERYVTQIDTMGRVIRHEEEVFEYDVPGAPWRTRTKTTYGQVYLPEVNPGRNYIKLEEEIEEVTPWTNLQPGPNLSRTIETEGYALYVLAKDRTSYSSEAEAKLAARGQTDTDDARLIADSARTWREAVSEGGVIEQSDEPQVAKWKLLETTTEWVLEEPDKYTVTGTVQSNIRPDDVRHYGPDYHRKESYQYRLPVPLDPPTVKASPATDYIRVEIEGGGAKVWGRDVKPERYRLLRRVASGGERSSSGDPRGVWDTDPDVPSRRRVWSDLQVTDLEGAAASPLPTAETYTEPGDTAEPDIEYWTVIAEVENEGDWRSEPHAVVADDDVVASTEYEYRAQAILGQDESEPGPIDSCSYGGTTRDSRITVRVNRDETGAAEIDVVSSDYPNLLEESYGETVEFAVPVEFPWSEGETAAKDYGEAVGIRQMDKYRDAKLEVSADVLLPLLILERGQILETPDVGWLTIGNDLQITSAINAYEWIVDGFRLAITRRPDGTIEGAERTRVYLRQP